MIDPTPVTHRWSRWVVLLAIGLVGLPLGPADAHNPNVATFVLEPVAATAGSSEAKGGEPGAAPTARGWLLTMHLPSSALHPATVAGLDARAQAALDEGAYKQRAVDYLKRHTRLTLDGARIELGPGGIRLAAHQSDLRFLLRGLPDAGATLVVQIDAFTEDGHQTNVLKIRGAARKTVLLTAEDGYRATIELRR